MIEIRGLKALHALAEHGTVTAAAAALGFTPSAVSQQIAHLGRELDVELLTRRGRGVQLTPGAWTLLAGAEEISAQWEEIRAQLVTAGSPAGPLRICGVSSAIAALVAPAVEHLREAHPDLEVSVREEESPECFHLLAHDKSDLAVVLPTPNSPASTDPRFEQRPLLDDRQDLLVSTGHPLAARDGVELGEAAHERWIATQRSNDTYAILAVACASAGFTPLIAHQAKEWFAVSALVGAGAGVCLIPRIVPIPAEHHVVRVPLSGRTPPSRHFITSVRRGSSQHPAIRSGLAALTRAARARTPEEVHNDDA